MFTVQIRNTHRYQQNKDYLLFNYYYLLFYTIYYYLFIYLLLYIINAMYSKIRLSITSCSNYFQ